MNKIARRQRLKTLSNPDESIDYLVTLQTNTKRPFWKIEKTLEVNSVIIVLRYVPDQLILEESSLNLYFQNLRNENATSSQQVGLMMLEDLNNELVPRWLHLTIITNLHINGLNHHNKVCFQDQQPNWNNIALFSSSEFT